MKTRTEPAPRRPQSAHSSKLPPSIKRKAIPPKPRRNLAAAFDALASMPADFMTNGRLDKPPQKRMTRCVQDTNISAPR